MRKKAGIHAMKLLIPGYKPKEHCDEVIIADCSETAQTYQGSITGGISFKINIEQIYTFQKSRNPPLFSYNPRLSFLILGNIFDGN